jgi:hypothetical protein
MAHIRMQKLTDVEIETCCARMRQANAWLHENCPILAEERLQTYRRSLQIHQQLAESGLTRESDLLREWIRISQEPYPEHPICQGYRVYQSPRERTLEEPGLRECPRATAEQLLTQAPWRNWAAIRRSTLERPALDLWEITVEFEVAREGWMLMPQFKPNPANNAAREQERTIALSRADRPLTLEDLEQMRLWFLQPGRESVYQALTEF